MRKHGEEMSRMGEMWRRVRMLVRGEKFARELEEEMRAHREMKERELKAEGVSEEEARHGANRAFGNAMALRERSGDAWGWRWLTEGWQDARFGVRMLRKNAGFTTVAVLTLALGIGANTTIFSLVNAVLLRPLPYPDAKEVVLMYGRTNQVARTAISYADLEDWRRQSHSFEGIAAWLPQSVNLTGQEKPERVRGAFVSANFFDVLGVRPEQGRGFVAGEDETGAERVAVVNHSIWVRKFGSDPNFVGKKLTLNGEVFTVAGILPPSFDFPVDPDRNEVWLPANTFTGFSRERSNFSFFAVGRMKKGVDVAAAQSEMKTIAKRLAEQYPDAEGQRSAVVRPLREVVTENLRPVLLVLFGAVGLVLLIACANVVNLLLARGAARMKEISLRTALGAGRSRLLRQMLTETMVLWMGAGVVGLLLGAAGLKAALAAMRLETPPGIQVGIDGWVLLFTFVVTGVAGVATGLAPALQFSRGDLEQALKEGGRTAGEGKGATRLRGGLLVAQVAMSVVLLAGSALMVRTIAELTGVRPGFDAKNLLTLEYRLPPAEYPEGRQQWNFHEQVAERVRHLPGVREASIALGIPFTGNIGTDPVVLLDRAAPPAGQEPVAKTNLVDAHYFETLRIPLIEGRTFGESDGSDTPRVAVINRTMAERFWNRASALGRQIELLDEKKPATIVGVVGDVKEESLDEKAQPEIYFAYAQAPYRFATLIVRTEGDPMSFAGAVRDAVWSVDRNQPMWKVKSMEAVMKNSVGDRRALAYLLSIYAGLATFLAAVGIYGVLSYSVNRRMREIGVRMALGAQARATLGLIVGQGMKSVGLGLGVGLAATIALTRTLAGLLYGVGANDPATIGGAVLVLGLAGLLACWIPAQRAARVDPMIVLRHE